MKSEAAEYSSVAQDIKALDQNNYAIVFRGKTSRTARLNDSAQSQFRIEISETKLIFIYWENWIHLHHEKPGHLLH